MGITRASSQISVPSRGMLNFSVTSLLACCACCWAMATLPFHDIARQVSPLARSLMLRSLSK
ncbi:hypothetical protein D3C77_740090 [compost metagenome]